ncbi:hypothetical protein JXA05_03165 [Candidatus Peregrinibacteria bacterium]|nr:hypothetical protein [Candidatus Peregrinibacteria bacterium]
MPQNLTPAYDNKIYQKYSKNTLQNKEKNKIAFLQDNDLPFSKKIPLVCITYPLTDTNNLGMITDVMNGILEQAVQVALIGVGTKKYQEYFTGLAEKNPQKIVIVSDSDENRRKVYAASDMALIAADSEECQKETEAAMGYGAVPITPPQNGVENYDPIHEKGNAFVYAKESPWSLFANFIRAFENFRFPYDWKNIEVEAMGND